ncbi:uncharacterized protein EDB91DRAFT_474416 [Suillus paluster]|uniref:uncharacterized protein n=1 Tax=Suillus paluster TaxID=48578 RepID=UPI001B87A3DC|nr:uncharacterized protein EDB91DRAFT_474416 [Suillus paluster]KAG1737903.1 hypothetical protein EDB91DRAFT_474416 [Suillus paluster]
MPSLYVHRVRHSLVSIHPMSLDLNYAGWWPVVDFNLNFSYFVVASSVAVIYDWALTFGQEFELVWRRRWSLMKALYLGVRYGGILYIAINTLQVLPMVSVTDVVSSIMYSALNWMGVVVNTMLGAIMITRLCAMYRRSRKMLIFLIVIFMAVMIAWGVMTAMVNRHTSGEDLVLFGTYQCTYHDEEADAAIFLSMTWILATVWEVLALCLAVWIVIKDSLELQRPSTGWTIGDCFTVLIQTHVVYFASFAAVSCFDLGLLSPHFSSVDVGTQVYDGVRQIVSALQMFVLGPRLVLSVRQYHAKLVANSDAGTDMSALAFWQPTHVPTDDDV